MNAKSAYLPLAQGSSRVLKQTWLPTVACALDLQLEGWREGVWRFPAAGEEAANAAVMKFDISFAESSRLHLD